jgi:hypothetical protein
MQTTTRALLHVPLRPLRLGLVGERVFALRWRELMKQPLVYDEVDGMDTCRLSHEVLRQISTYRRIRQRDARVAASLVAWIGTNCGACAIHQARNLRTALKENPWAASDAYLVQFARENSRKHAVNSGFRLIEHLLAGDACYQVRMSGCREQVFIPNYTWQDQEVAEQTFCWLGTEAGERFVIACEQEIVAERTARKAAI